MINFSFRDCLSVRKKKRNDFAVDPEAVDLDPRRSTTSTSLVHRSFIRWIILIDDTFPLPPINYDSSIDFWRGRGFSFPLLENEELNESRMAERQIGRMLRMYIVSSFFPAQENFDCWPWLSFVFVKRRYSRCTSGRLAQDGWITLAKLVRLVPCGTLIPWMMGDGGGLHHLDLRLHVVLDADEVRCRDLGSVVRDLHGRHMGDLNVEGLGVWGWNSWLLRNLEHLVHFRSVYLRNFPRR